MVYFDNAATTFPKPAAVKNAVDLAILRYGANPGRSGHDLSTETARQVYCVREKVAAFFGAEDAGQVVFTQNCTYALNTAIKGLVRPGDHVIISDLEHNSVLRPVHALSMRGELDYTIAETFEEDDQTVESFRNAIRYNTKAIICTHASNVFGIKLPVERLAQLAHAYGLYFVLDAAQTAGVEPIGLSAMQIDFLCTAGHKGLYGPSGTGLLITRFGERLRPLVEGGTGSASADYSQPDFMPDRLESGTLNTAGIIGLGAGIDFVNQRGMERIARHEAYIARCVYEGLAGIQGIKLYAAPPQYGVNLPVLSFNVEGLSSEEATSQLNRAGFAVRGGLHCAPPAHKKFGTIGIGGTIRVSAGAFNTEEHARGLICAVQNIVRFVEKKD